MLAEFLVISSGRIVDNLYFQSLDARPTPESLEHAAKESCVRQHLHRDVRAGTQESPEENVRSQESNTTFSPYTQKVTPFGIRPRCYHVDCEPAADPWPRARCRIFFRAESVRHHFDARPSSALRHHPFAGFAAGPLASVGSRNRARALCD